MRAGYVVVTQDSRGRYASAGQYAPFTVEDTGDIDKMAHNVADHFEEEAQTAIKQMAVSITPVAVLIAGVIVAIMAISFYTGGYVRLLGID